MSRSKKSRKPGAGSNGAVKEEKKKLAIPAPKRIRKKAGKQAGNRQQEARISQQTNTGENQNKDPRLGSKTPIVLTKAVESPKNKVIKAKQETRAPIPALRSVEPEQPSQQALLIEELENIEQDVRLQVILTKQEDEISLSEDDIEYFNTLMERHEQISNELGLEDDEDSSVNTTNKSEDQLWDKLDNGDLSDYQ
jgi:ribosome assembly protein YihI (activator of Der GTPase)